MTGPLSITLAAAILAAAALEAQQQPPPPYQSVGCLKLRPGVTPAQFRQFVTDGTMKVAQVLADSGEIVSWSLLRSIMPMGEEARCDYVVSMFSEGPPPEPGTPREAEYLKKAALKMTPAEYAAKRDALIRVVSIELWRPLIRVGQPKKGNYLYLNFMRVHNQGEYTKFEQSVWKPMAEEWVKTGAMSAWGYAVKQLPGGTDVKYSAFSVDVFPTWDAVFKGLATQAMFAKVHAGQNYQETMERLNKLRNLAERQLLIVEERISKQ